MPDLYWMQKVRNIKLENNNNGDCDIMLMNLDNHQGNFLCGKRLRKKQNCPQKARETKEKKTKFKDN